MKNLNVTLLVTEIMETVKILTVNLVIFTEEILNGKLYLYFFFLKKEKNKAQILNIELCLRYTHPAFTCSNSAMETLECVKSVRHQNDTTDGWNK